MASDSFTVEATIDLDSKELAPLNIYCLPVSGGGFSAQLGLLSEVYDAKWIVEGRVLKGSKAYQPDLVFAASGGNVATYIAMAGDWSPSGIIRVAEKIETPMFIRSWFPQELDFLPTWLIGVMKGSLYREGYGSSDLFRVLYTPESVQRTEIWTGTYDAVNHRAQFFCNLSREKSLINPDYMNELVHFYGMMPMKYLGGDLDRIARACMASASIPILVGKQKMDGCGYADGGTMYASPTTVMTGEIYRLIMGDNPLHERLEREVKAALPTTTSYTQSGAGGKTDPLTFRVDAKSQTVGIDTSAALTHSSAYGQRALRLIYFCSYEMDVPRGVTPATGESGRFSDTLAQLLHSSVLQDRASVTNLLRMICGDASSSIVFTHYPRLDKTKLAELLIDLNQQRHYVIALYPHGNPSVNLRSFTHKDIAKSINEVRAGYGAYVWYFPNLLNKGDPPKVAK